MNKKTEVHRTNATYAKT